MEMRRRHGHGVSRSALPGEIGGPCAIPLRCAKVLTNFSSSISQVFRETCLGKAGCYGSEGAVPFIDDEAERAILGLTREHAQSGRGCFRCASRFIERSPLQHKVLFD